MTHAVLLTRSGSTEDTDVVFPLLLSSYSSYRGIQPDTQQMRCWTQGMTGVVEVSEKWRLACDVDFMVVGVLGDRGP